MEDDDYNRPKNETEKQQQYLFLLQERNRLKKMMNFKTGINLNR